MKKRILGFVLMISILSSLIATLPITASASTSGTCGDNLTWTFSGGTLTISGTGPMYDWHYDSFPWKDFSGDISTVIIKQGVASIGEHAFFRCYNLSSVSIPPTVITICSSAFFCCVNLKSIIIPDSVTTIGSGAFSMSGIMSLTIPDSVTHIGNGAFHMCQDLTSITIPGSITTLGPSLFSLSENLTNVIICNGVTSIQGTFSGCLGLKSITIPNSVTSIEERSFYFCENLTDVYYTGTQDEWKKISISETDNECLRNATIHFNYGPFESLFSKSAYNYNHSLARTTFEFVEAGFSATTDEFAKGGSDTSPIAKKRYANIKNKYDEYGFTDNQKFYNYGIALTDTSDKAAYSIASKDISVDGKTKKLVALVVRGGNYGGEWVSNFNVGTDSTYSQGFKKPADDIIKKLKSYISASKSKEVVLWITGYSRGAAIANLVAANMVDYSESCSYLNADNIFVYTFATPNPVHRKNANTGKPKYNNIFNIVNPADPVPYVLLSDWGYSKFGTTKTILSSVPSAVKNEYKEITGNTYSISQEQRSAISNLIKLLSNLADTKQEFNSRYAESIKDIIHWLMVNKKVDKNATLTEYATTKYASNDIVRCYQYASGDVDAYKKVLKKAGITDEYIKLAKEVGMILELNGISMDELLDDLTGNNSLSLLKSVFKIISSVSSLDGQFAGLGSVHEPDTYRAWLFGLDDPEKIYGVIKSAEELLNENTNKYKKQLIHCPVDIEVTDKDGNVVVSVVNHEILIDELPVVVIDDKIIVYYYDNFEDYNVKITAYEDGKVNYYISEYASGEEETKRVCYNNIEVFTNDVLTGAVNDVINTDVSNYNLTLSENIIENTEILKEEQLENLSVTVIEEGDGTATEINNASKGDYITLIATPSVGTEFIGWYDEETCLSEDLDYSFTIEENCIFTAKFTVSDAEISDITVPEIENGLISNGVTITANNDVEGVLVFKAYNGNTYITECKSNVSMNAGETKTFISQFVEDGVVNRITACLYDNNSIAKTTELGVSVVRDLQTGENDEYKYILYPDGTIEITQIKVTVDKLFEIPNKIDNYMVSAIGNNLFGDKNELMEVIIPETVTRIDTSAFVGCENFKWLNFKGSLEEWNCVTLNGEELPETVSIATNYENTPAKIHSVSLFNENEKEFVAIDFDYVKEEANIYFAMYDSTGKMNFVKHSLVTPGKRTTNFEIDVEYDPETSYAKVFCWSNKDMLRPICLAHNFNFSQQ